MDAAYLVLENGQVFKGKSFGAKREAKGEIVFTTDMTGYLETLTNPAYHGKIVVQTFPLIGNYGVISEELKSETVQVAGYIVKHWCEDPSNFRSEGDIHTFLEEQNIVGLCEIDTRQLTKIIREHGPIKGRITMNCEEIKNAAK